MQTAVAGAPSPRRPYRMGPGRKPNLSVLLMLPVPPQTFEERSEWLASTGYTIGAARFGCVPGTVQVIIRTPTAGTKNLKALAEPILAALAKYGIVECEERATAITIEWAEGIPPGIAAVTVRQISSPETRRRIQLALRRARDAKINGGVLLTGAD